MTSLPGTYALVLACHRAAFVWIGRLGTWSVPPGFYVYVGSAFGPGGLSARLQHHQHKPAHPHWHMDYLRAICDLVEVWFTTEAARCEHSWAKAVARLPGAWVPVPGFGSSDCKCQTHLFRFDGMPSVRAFRQRVKTRVLRTRSALSVHP